MMTKYLLLWLGAVTISLSGSVFYARYLRRLSDDIFRILCYVGWIVFCFFLPIALLLWMLGLPEFSDISSLGKALILLSWLIPLFTAGIVLRMKGCFISAKEKNNQTK